MLYAVHVSARRGHCAQGAISPRLLPQMQGKGRWYGPLALIEYRVCGPVRIQGRSGELAPEGWERPQFGCPLTKDA
jgi:hypothetical protein